MKVFDELIEIIARLRHPEKGCPWDLEQTHESLKTYLLEETYEVLDAIEDKPEELREELGDLLLQIMLHSQIASESKDFSIEDVIQELNEKLIHRHPHVFADASVRDAQEVAQNWQKLKGEKKTDRESLLDGLPKTLPALSYAHKIGQRCEKVDFDWDTPNSVLQKLDEECEELREQIVPEVQSNERAAEELGDVLFTAAQLARKLGKDPETLLRSSCKKFESRFRKMEALCRGDLGELSNKERDDLWNQVKKSE